MKWPLELRSKSRDEVLQNVHCLLRFLIVKTADEDPESLEMGTRSAEDGGLGSLPGPSSDWDKRKFSFQ
jgi:hypothetical protein